MSVTREQAETALLNLMDAMDNVIDQLNTSSSEVVGYELSITRDDLTRVTFNLEFAFNLEAGE